MLPLRDPVYRSTWNTVTLFLRLDRAQRGCRALLSCKRIHLGTHETCLLPDAVVHAPGITKTFRRISRRIRLPSSRKSDRHTWHSGFLLYLYRNPRQKYFRAGYCGVPCRGTECFRHRVENKGFPRSPSISVSDLVCYSCLCRYVFCFYIFPAGDRAVCRAVSVTPPVCSPASKITSDGAAALISSAAAPSGLFYIKIFHPISEILIRLSVPAHIRRMSACKPHLSSDLVQSLNLRVTELLRPADLHCLI